MTRLNDDGIVVVRSERVWNAMPAAIGDDELMSQMTDRFERRLVEETSQLRGDVSAVRVEISGLRADMARDRFELLKWAFAFWIGQFFATAALIAALTRR